MADDVRIPELLRKEPVWNALSVNPAVGVAVLDLLGTIVHANPAICRMFLGDVEPADVHDRNLFELYPKAWAEERMDVLERVRATGRPIIMRHIRRGVQLESEIAPIEVDDGPEPLILVLTTQGESSTSDDGDEHLEVVESAYADFGPLDVLTRRELEVLALLKHGMTAPQIASELRRSPRTVEKHVASMMHKLRVAGRAELLQIAMRAGLELRDATLARTSEPA